MDLNKDGVISLEEFMDTCRMVTIRYVSLPIQRSQAFKTELKTSNLSPFDVSLFYFLFIL